MFQLTSETAEPTKKAGAAHNRARMRLKEKAHEQHESLRLRKIAGIANRALNHGGKKDRMNQNLFSTCSHDHTETRLTRESEKQS
jgi:hypothetical protein